MRDQVIEAVRNHLARTGHCMTFEVIEAAVRQDSEWWYVPILVSWTDGKQPTHEMLVNLYANVEESASSTLDTNILLIPAAA